MGFANTGRALCRPWSKQKAHLRRSFLKRVSNSPLCNSSPTTSTVVREKITKRYFGLSELQCFFMCILVRAERGRVQRWRTSMDTELGSERFVGQKLTERVRYRIRALLHLAEAPFISKNRVGGPSLHTWQPSGKLPATQAVIQSFFMLAPTGTVLNLILSQRRR